MAYVGNPIDTQNTFQSLVGKRFSGDGSTTAFTLDVAPGNVLDIEVFVGNVRQDPNSAYTLSGTTLTFTGAPPSGTNNIYVVHQAKSVGTIDVPASGVQAGSLASSVLTGQTDIGGAIADADLFLVDDGAGGTLRKTAASRIKTYIGDNTPSCLITVASTTGFSNDTLTKLAFDTEIYDTDNAFSSNKFTVPSGQAGKYYINIQADIDSQADGNLDYALIYIYKNGSDIRRHNYDFRNNPARRFNTHITSVLQLAESDYIEGYIYAYDSSGSPQYVAGNSNKNGTQFMMYKLIEE